MSLNTSHAYTSVAAAIITVVALLAATTTGVAQVATSDAQLAVSQPDYVEGDVQRSSANGTVVYTINHRTAELKPKNFASADVVGFGVATEAGQLTYNEAFDTYEFDAGNNTGTFRVYWEVERPASASATSPTNETNATNASGGMIRERYEAVIRVTDATEYAHLKGGTVDSRSSAAANWSSFAGAVREIYGPDADVERRTQQAIDLLRLQADPLAALSGSYTSTWLILLGLGGVGGPLVLITIGIWHLWTRRGDIKFRNREESLKADAADLDDRLRDLQHDERARVLQNKDWQDIIPDDQVARAMRDTLGETVFDGVVRLQETLLPRNLIRDRLYAMHHAGYVGVVRRAATDGGDDTHPDTSDDGTDADAPIDAAWVAHEADTLPDDAVTVALDDVSEAFIDALDWTDDDLVSFDLPNADVPDDAGVTVDGLSLDDLLLELDAQRQALDDPEAYGEYLLAFVQDVRESEYCDDQGTPDEMRYLMNHLLQISQKTTGKFEFPLLEFMGDSIERAMIEHEPLREATEAVDDVRSGKGS